MQSISYSEKKKKLRGIWILLTLAICGKFFWNLFLFFSKPYYGGFISFIVWVVPYLVLLLSVTLLWEQDKRHIGVFVFIILQIVKEILVCLRNFSLVYRSFLLYSLLLVALWVVSAIFFYKGFQNRFRWNIGSKDVLYIALLFTLCEDAIIFSQISIAAFLGVYLLFRDFSFQPLNDRAGETKRELEQLQEAYDQGYLSEEVYQKRRQDIINRI